MKHEGRQGRKMCWKMASHRDEKIHSIVFSRGEIVEQGTFNELLRQNGVFAAMARKQGIDTHGR